MIPTSLALPPLQNLTQRQSECLFSILCHVLRYPDRPDRVAYRTKAPYFVVSRRTGLGREAVAVVYCCRWRDTPREIGLGDGRPYRGSVSDIEIVSITTHFPAD